MSKLAKVGDIAVGTCYDHTSPRGVTGVIVSGSSNCTCNGMNIARIGDTVAFDCGHVGVVASGSSTVFCNNIPVARIGDAVTGPMTATIVSGSNNVNSN